MQIKKNQIKKIFAKLNMVERSTKHNYGWLIVGGKKILRVYYSHGKGDIPARVSDKIRGQLKLSQRDFKNLIDCPLTYKSYLEILKDKDIV